jgi:predicted O-methyltransferase YrrM
MFDLILKQVAQTDFDFRQIANPDDPAKQRFDEWVDYYKLKAAIAKVVQPRSILEIGVRFGYSAAAFLHGNPAASYVGIDNDSDSFGGTKGAIEWARQMLRDKKATFLVADSQSMKRFPGGIYDLIHVDGQQDGDGTYHDLELAVKQGRVVLVDGYFWTATNFHAVNEFLFRHKDIIECFGAIPGYAGELLIKVKPEFLESSAAMPVGAAGSEPLRDCYSAQYFLRDCGGWDTFRMHGGRCILDPRLGSMVDLAFLKSPKRLLDLGCGRGETVYAAASRGVEVTAVDYSPRAMEIAKGVFAANEACARRVEWICDSVASAALSGTYDAVVASDIIEHLTPVEVTGVYAKVAAHLAAGGRFIVHTSPNRWHYQYDYERRRRIAASVGAYLPREPRTRYEKLMHINEQSPNVLRRELRRHFKHVALWFGSADDAAGSLARPFTRREMAAARDLYAVASQEPVATGEMAELLRSNPMPAPASAQVTVEMLDCPTGVSCGSKFEIKVKVVNNSDVMLRSHPPYPVRISYHWVEARTGEMVVHDGQRTFLAPALPAKTAATYNALVCVPARKGDFRLEARLVQEGSRWFGEVGPAGNRDRVVAVR